MSRRIIINSTPAETRVAIQEDGRLTDFFVERAERDRVLGSIIVGRVVKIAHSMQAAFIDIGLESDGFLPLSDVRGNLIAARNKDSQSTPQTGKGRRNHPIKPGDLLPVQVVKEPIAHKGARLTGQLSLPGRYMVYLNDDKTAGVSRRITSVQERRRLRTIANDLRAGGGIIIRTVAEDHSLEDITADLNELQSTWEKIVVKLMKSKHGTQVHRDLGMVSGIMRDLFTRDISRVFCDNRRLFREIQSYIGEVQPRLRDKVEYYKKKEPIFDSLGIESEIEKCFERKVWIKGGGYLIIELTEAMISIDVNSGRYARKKSIEETAVKVNLAAAKEICLQLRLRDIGGLVVIDFIDMRKSENRRQVQDLMRNELKNDRAQTDVAPISMFGLMEMTRERVRPALLHTLNLPCKRCGGSGLVPSKETMISELERWIRRFRADTKERRLQIHVEASIHEYLSDGLRSRIREIMWRNFIHVKLISDDRLDDTEFRCWSPKQAKEVTAEYLGGIGAIRMLKMADDQESLQVNEEVDD
jgi:ribonuclease G